MSSHLYTHKKDYYSPETSQHHNFGIDEGREHIIDGTLPQGSDFTGANKTHTVLSTIATGINAVQSPLQLMSAIDTAHAHMGNQAVMNYVSQQYQQQVHDVAQDGFRERPRAFPFREQIQQAFGEYYDISDLEAHTGAAAQAANARLGSRAYHKGGRLPLPDNPRLKKPLMKRRTMYRTYVAINLRGDW